MKCVTIIFSTRRKKGAVIRAKIDNDNDMYASIDKASHMISNSLKKHNEMHNEEQRKSRRKKILLVNEAEEELDELVFDEESMPDLRGVPIFSYHGISTFTHK